MRLPTVTILILSRNRSWSLMQTVASIREFVKWPYKIIIQDHASEEDEKRHIEKLAGPDCRIHFEDKFLSCIEGRRLGLNRIRSEYCAFLDDDIRVCPEWIGNMMNVMLAKPHAAAVVSNLMIDRERTQSGIRLVQGNAMITAPWGDAGQGDACTGGCTLYRTKRLKETEFRAIFNAGYEDWDQTLQLTKQLGYEIWGSTASVIHHHQKDSLKFIPDRWRFNELLDAAIAMARIWGIHTGIAKELHRISLPSVRVNPRQDQWEAIAELGLR